MIKLVNCIRDGNGNKVLDGRYMVLPNSVIGIGTMGKVKRCVRLLDQKMFAMKVVYNLMLKKKGWLSSKEEREQRFFDEVEIWSQISKSDSPHIVHLIEAVQCYGSGNDLKYYLVMDLFKYGACMIERSDGKGFRLPDEMAAFLDHTDDGCYTEQSAKQIIKAMAAALADLNKRGYCHRDIKPSNIVIGDDGQIALTDFSEACLLTNAKGTAGTYPFLPPEQVSCEQADSTDGHAKSNGPTRGHAADMWALGVTLYCLLYCDLPFDGDSIMELFDQISRNQISCERVEGLSPECRDCLMGLLESSPEKRLTASALMTHKWFQ